MIGSIRREMLDHTFFWTEIDLVGKLLDYKTYFNHHRTHMGLGGSTPVHKARAATVDLANFRWQSHCRGLFELPLAA